MNKLKSITRYTLYTLLALVFTSCTYQKNEREMFVWLKYDSGLGYSETKVYCDSVQMISISEAYIFIDGVKQRVLAERVRPCSN